MLHNKSKYCCYCLIEGITNGYLFNYCMIILGLVTGTVTSMIVALIFVFLGIAMFVVHLIK